MAAGVLAACTTREQQTARGDADPERQEDGVETIRYGDDPSQQGELTRPAGTSKGVVVVIHGGFWRDQYDLSLGRPLAASLADEGWTAFNIEYRRVGNGGGWPQTFDDVAAAIDALADVDDLDTSTVVTLGHSAGGHLAVWAAARPQLSGSPWASPAVPVTAAVSHAGVLDLAAAIAADLGDGAVQRFMGGTVDDRYALADPSAAIPLSVPVRCVHGTSDTTVPLSQSTDYVARARAAGADAELTAVEGDHFVVIDPSSRAWSLTLQLLETLRTR
ncbi:alpha/beta hydrolase [Aeromicrobium endophyticum]|uniref:Alpha/beta hydrolase n=2 Tax=Aeromicrobium endophyticum TaxID=2292704 RepID=A0A371PDK3_9ACTN|nr:alpha/beta hydrolase [Aeromicrobium endophyticum]